MAGFRSPGPFLVRLCLQDDRRLAARKRRLFSELSDEEVTAMEAAVREAMGGG
ncbi:MAG: hypothetical protein OXU69_07125 [Gemmatimonadota bacterium]|nr:hypothetical protein [Gemmatimonadota bacterium]MDE2984462.1 hypothetical protein [Gemmatimonadota bacterium]